MSTSPHPDELLLDFAYGELPKAREAAVRSHVETCSACAGTVATLRGVRATMSALPPASPPDAGVDSLLAYAAQAAGRHAAPKARSSHVGRWLMAATGVLTLVVIALLATAPHPESERTSRAPLASVPAPPAEAPAATPSVGPLASREPAEGGGSLGMNDLAKRSRRELRPEQGSGAEAELQAPETQAAAPPAAPPRPHPARAHSKSQTSWPPAEALARAENVAPAPRAAAPGRQMAGAAADAEADVAPGAAPAAKAAALRPSAASPSPSFSAPAPGELSLIERCRPTPPRAPSSWSRAACVELVRRFPGTPVARMAEAELDAHADGGTPTR